MNRIALHTLITLLLVLSMAACKTPTASADDDDGGGTPPPPPPPANPCAPVTPTGRLAPGAGAGVFDYTTSGGGRVGVAITGTILVTHADYTPFAIQLWGSSIVDGDTVSHANHENLNGKHLKDRILANRTIIFPDGAKLTIATEGEAGRVLTVSIYEGNQSHRVDFKCGTLVHSSLNQADADRMEGAELDGETSRFVFTETGLLFETIYFETAPGRREPFAYPLGTLILGQPKQVNDLFNDPRLSHT